MNEFIHEEITMPRKKQIVIDREGSFIREEAGIVRRLKAAGWRVWDWEEDGPEADNNRCDFYGTCDLINCTSRRAWQAMRQALDGEPIDPRPDFEPVSWEA
jgi:hypothetical protein